MDPHLSYVVLLLWDPVIEALRGGGGVSGGGRGGLTHKKQSKPSLERGEVFLPDPPGLISIFSEPSHRHSSICDLSGHSGSLTGV